MIELPDTTTEHGQRQASALLAKAMGVYSQLFDDCVKFRFRGENVLVYVFPHHHGWYRVTEDNDASFHHSPYPEGRGRDTDDVWRHFVNLYEPTNMSLAWQVLNFAMTYPMDTEAGYQFRAKFQLNTNFGEMLSLPPAAAQRAWLDKILDLANEAGILDKEQQGV